MVFVKKVCGRCQLLVEVRDPDNAFCRPVTPIFDQPINSRTDILLQIIDRPGKQIRILLKKSTTH